MTARPGVRARDGVHLVKGAPVSEGPRPVSDL